MRNLKINKIIWLIITLMALVASLVGIINQDIYDKVVSNIYIPGVMSQDGLTIILSIIALFLIISVKENEGKKQIIILGIVGYIFYAYGIYVIEQLYTVLYLLYIAIFGFSFYSIIFSVMSLNKNMFQKITLSKLIKTISIVFLLFVPSLFYPLWTSKIIELIKISQKLEFTFSVFILDLCFIMPLFIIVAIMLIKNIKLGLFIAPTLLIKGFTVLFSVGIGEFLKPLYQQTTDISGASFYIGLSLIFLLITVLYLRNLKLNAEEFILDK